jgi:hypothetical protein
MVAIADVDGGKDYKNNCHHDFASPGFPGLHMPNHNLFGNNSCCHEIDGKDFVNGFDSCCNISLMDLQLKSMHKKWSI